MGTEPLHYENTIACFVDKNYTLENIAGVREFLDKLEEQLKERLSKEKFQSWRSKGEALKDETPQFTRREIGEEGVDKLVENAKKEINEVIGPYYELGRKQNPAPVEEIGEGKKPQYPNFICDYCDTTIAATTVDTLKVLAKEHMQEFHTKQNPAPVAVPKDPALEKLGWYIGHEAIQAAREAGKVFRKEENGEALKDVAVPEKVILGNHMITEECSDDCSDKMLLRKLWANQDKIIDYLQAAEARLKRMKYPVRELEAKEDSHS